MTQTDPNAFEEKLLTIDLIDGLRREQERLDAALNDGARMKTLRSEIQAYYQSAGIAVSDAVIDQAIAERQAQRLTFKPHRLGWTGRALASGYIHRRRIAAATAVLCTLGLVVGLVDFEMNRSQRQRALAAYRIEQRQQLDLLEAVQRDQAKLPAELPTLTAGEVPAVAVWSQELDTAYHEARLALTPASECTGLELPDPIPLEWPGEARLKRCQAAVPEQKAALERAQQLLSDHGELATAVQRFQRIQQRVASTPALLSWRAVADGTAELANSITPGSAREGFVAAAERTAHAVDAIATIVPVYSRASSCLKDAIPRSNAHDRGTLEDLLDKGQLAQQSEQPEGVEQWSKQADSACRFFRTPITLRIVSQPGERTGVWRYYEANTSAKTYYIIVDALSGGSETPTLIRSAEDQQVYERSRFGVRVDEGTFEAIKRDKQDDGQLRDSEAGRKPANSLQWQLDDGFEPMFIAEW